MRKSTLFYIAIMMFAAGITLVRSFAIAAILPLAEFGAYATIVAAGVFGSNLLGLGLIERTYKAYPRLWADSRQAEAVNRAGEAVRVLTLRFFLLLPVAAFSGYLVGVGVMSGVGFACVALSTSITGVYASLHRATTETYSLSVTTLVRAGLSIGLALVGAWTLGWSGAVFGEFFAALVGAYISRRCVINMAGQIPGSGQLPTVPESSTQDSDAKGLWVFLGFLAAAAPAYLDRSFIAISFDVKTAGTYAFLSLFVVAANTMIGIFVQKVGPNLIQMERLGATVSQQLRYVLRWLAMFWALWLVGIATAAIVLIGGGGGIWIF